MQLDVAFARSHFPAFREPELQEWAFFENAGGSYACQQVIDRLSSYYCRTKVQPYGNWPASRRAGEAMDAAYERLAGYLNVAPDEVHFGPSTTQNLGVLATACGELLQPGDEIVVTNQDHEANAGAWRKLAARGMILKEWLIDPRTGQLCVDDLKELLSARTRLVAMPHCSNVVGQENRVREVADAVHAVGGWLVVDGVSWAPHGLPDVAELGADAYLFSLYKTFGPHQGLMVVRRELMDQLPNQGHFFNRHLVHKKLVPAGPDHGQIAAAAGIADYLDAMHAHHFDDCPGPAERGRRLERMFIASERALLGELLSFLTAGGRCRVLGPLTAAGRAPTVALVPLERSVGEVAAILESEKIAAGSGHFYAVRPLEALGIDPSTGVIRLSFVHTTTGEELGRLQAALAKALG